MNNSNQRASTLTSPEGAKVSTAVTSFALPRTEEEIEKAQVQSIPKKTRNDTAYCVRLVRIYNSFCRNSGAIVGILFV